MDEQPLSAGNSTEVVRVQDTVRRTAGPWTGSVRRLLAALREAGMTEVPEHFGLDERGREILSYLPGEVAPLPAAGLAVGARDPPGVRRAVAAHARREHDPRRAAGRLATADPPTGRGHLPQRRRPVQHGLPPGNLRGLIDFDTASPGPRIWDLAYLAYQLVPFTETAGGAAAGLAARRDRLGLLIDAYGQPFLPADVLRVAADRLVDLAR